MVLAWLNDGVDVAAPFRARNLRFFVVDGYHWKNKVACATPYVLCVTRERINAFYNQMAKTVKLQTAALHVDHGQMQQLMRCWCGGMTTLRMSLRHSRHDISAGWLHMQVRILLKRVSSLEMELKANVAQKCGVDEVAQGNPDAQLDGCALQSRLVRFQLDDDEIAKSVIDDLDTKDLDKQNKLRGGDALVRKSDDAVDQTKEFDAQTQIIDEDQAIDDFMATLHGDFKWTRTLSTSSLQLTHHLQ